MNTGDPSNLTYLCPRCQTLLTARPEDAGNRQECPHCGKVIKVPGTAQANAGARKSDSAATDAAINSGQSGTISGHGVANVAVICPVCGTRMYATSAQIGQTMICPDCLETVPIEPAPSSAPQETSEPASTSGESAGSSLAGAAHAESESAPSDSPKQPQAEDDDEFKLAAPVEVSSAAILPKDLLDMVEKERHSAEAEVDGANTVDATDATDTAKPPETPSAKAAPKPEPKAHGPSADTFRVQCPVCDTMIYATADEIGQTKTCPDCYTSVVIERPKPKRKRVNDVVEPADDEELFTLAAPVELDVFHDMAETAVPSPEQMVLQDAEKRVQERERELPPLPDRPLINGVLRMLFEPGTLVRWGLFTLFLFVIGSSTLWIIENLPKGGIFWVYSLGLGILSLFIIVLGGAFVTVSCLAIVQESAIGADKVEAWPDLNFLEWMFDGFFVMFALFYAITPGMLLSAVLLCAGTPEWATTMMTGIIAFFLFPIVQLSLLEGASLTTPFTTPVLESLRTQTRLWLGFYALVGGLMLVVLIGGMFVPVDWAVTRLLACIVWAGCLLFYYRLLGRLAWAVQARAMEEKRKAKITGAPAKPPKTEH